MSDVLVHKVRETIDRHQMLATGDVVILAVSGGVDSMAMLHVLLYLRTRYHASLHIAHLNHNLRGAESAKAADFVRRQGEAYQVPVTVMTADGRTLRSRRSGSLQALARDHRYRFLEQVADNEGAGRIAVGHHRNDQAETVLMNLLRGSGVRGLGGIPPVRGRIIRPLIDCSREEIERYTRKERIPYVEDSSNRTLAYCRNRIRAELLPELAKCYNPRVVHTLANAATVFESEDRLLNEVAERELHTVLISRSQAEYVLSIPAMAILPNAIRWRIIRRAAEELRDGRSGLTFQQTVAADRLLMTNAAHGAMNAPNGLRVRRAGDSFVLSMGDGHVGSCISSCLLTVPGLTAVPDSALRLQSDLLERRESDELTHDAWTALLDADRIGVDVSVRGWEEGDRFVPLGMSGRKKLQDFFVDEKVPRDQRGSIPLVVAGDRIVWVVGFRVDERFKVTDSTRRILRVHATTTAEL